MINEDNRTQWLAHVLEDGEFVYDSFIDTRGGDWYRYVIDVDTKTGVAYTYCNGFCGESTRHSYVGQALTEDEFLENP